MINPVFKTFRYRIYPTKQQANTLKSHLEICRELYNAALQERRDAWRLNRKSVNFYDQSYQVKDIRADRSDVAMVNAQALVLVLYQVDQAFKSFFRRVKAGQRAGYPRFKSINRYNSISYRQVGPCLKGNKLRLSKVGNIRIKLSRPLQGEIKTLTIRHDAGHWHASFFVECDPSPLPFSAQTVGVDVGLKKFAVLSDGTAIENPRYSQAAQAKLRRLQRRIARRKKGSNRRRKAALLLRRFHGHIQSQRRDFLHVTSRRLIQNHGLIAVENLNIKGMVRGMLAKSIHDAAWSTFMFMLTYKAEEAGRVLVRVDSRGTSQTCTCGATVRKALKDRWHFCLNCGLSADRDHISAQVILSRAERHQALTSPVAECVV